ncbi:hypothetical protein J3F84DRAFT_106182 [Trichoderma pleuroticola]
MYVLRPCHVRVCTSMETAGGDRCVVQIPPILRHLRKNITKMAPSRLHRLACLTTGWAYQQLASHGRRLTPASKTPRLVTFCLSLAACLGLVLSRHFSSLASRPRQVFHHKDAEPRPRRTARWTWASLNRPDIGSKS